MDPEQMSGPSLMRMKTGFQTDVGIYNGAKDANGKKEGQGKCVWSNGASYDGGW